MIPPIPAVGARCLIQKGGSMASAPVIAMTANAFDEKQLFTVLAELAGKNKGN